MSMLSNSLQTSVQGVPALISTWYTLQEGRMQ